MARGSLGDINIGVPDRLRPTPVAPPDLAATPPTPQDLINDLLSEERFKERRDSELQGIEAKRNKDLQSGRDFIKDFSLDRIKTTPLAAENEQIRALLESRLGGLNAGEGAAMREQAFRGLNQQRQGDIRDLRGIQGAQGVRGPAAVAQQQNVFSQAADRGSDLEQQLLLRNIEIQRRAAGDFTGEVSRQQGQQLGIDQFNIGQQGREAGIQQAFPFLFANLGAQEQSAATGAVTGRDALIASLFPDLISQQQGGAGAGAGAGAGNPSGLSQANAQDTIDFLNTIGAPIPQNILDSAAGPKAETNLSPEEQSHLQNIGQG